MDFSGLFMIVLSFLLDISGKYPEVLTFGVVCYRYVILFISIYKIRCNSHKLEIVKN